MIRSVHPEENIHGEKRYNDWWNSLDQAAKTTIVNFCNSVLGTPHTSSIKDATLNLADPLTWAEIELQRDPSLGKECYCINADCHWGGIYAGLPFVARTNERLCPRCNGSVVDEEVTR